MPSRSPLPRTLALLATLAGCSHPAPATDAAVTDALDAPASDIFSPDAPADAPDAPADAPVVHVPFASGPYGINPRDVAGPFHVATTDGDWDFQSAWTGDDSYVFLTYAPGLL